MKIFHPLKIFLTLCTLYLYISFVLRQLQSTLRLERAALLRLDSGVVSRIYCYLVQVITNSLPAVEPHLKARILAGNMYTERSALPRVLSQHTASLVTLHSSKQMQLGGRDFNILYTGARGSSS